MHVDARLVYDTLREVPAIATAAEHLGFDGLWTSETNHDPFLGLAVAALHSTRLELGTAIALAFTRSPTVLAHTAWDLAQLAAGRFALGLGTQVRAHVVRRFGGTWESPARRLRDVVGAIRAVWAAWADGGPLDYRGRYVTLTLMTPFFTPPGPPPAGLRIELAGVGARMCRLAGEIADGFHVHPFHTRHYLRTVIVPHLEAGRARAGRARQEVRVASSVFLAVGTPAEVAAGLATIRRHVAFYASTPAYRAVLDLHGWGEVGERLGRLAARGAWDEMPAQVPDGLLEACALWGSPDEVGARLRAEYGGLVDRVVPYEALVPGQREAAWRALLAAAR